MPIHGRNQELGPEILHGRGLTENGLEPVTTGKGSQVGAVGRGGRSRTMVPGGGSEHERRYDGAVVWQLVVEGVRPERSRRRLAAQVDGTLFLLRVTAPWGAAHGGGGALVVLRGRLFSFDREVKRKVEVGRRQALVVVQRAQGAVQVRVLRVDGEGAQQSSFTTVTSPGVLEPNLMEKRNETFALIAFCLNGSLLSLQSANDIIKYGWH